MAESAHHGGRLAAHRLQELWIGRRDFTPQHEVLPHQNASAVAFGEKLVIFVNSSAPNTHHIAAQVAPQLQILDHAVGVLTVHGIGGNPVRPADENRRAVDNKPEAAVAPLVEGVRTVEPNGSHAGLPGRHVHHRPVFAQFQRAVV